MEGLKEISLPPVKVDLMDLEILEALEIDLHTWQFDFPDRFADAGALEGAPTWPGDSQGMDWPAETQ